LFAPEFGYRLDVPFQQRFAADGHMTIIFFAKKAGVIDRVIVVFLAVEGQRLRLN
jgi:hypothetical protein